MSDAVEAELKPCPFCGKAAYLEGSDEVHFFVGCLNCYANVGESYDRSAMPDHMFMTAAEATAARNTRALLAAVEGSALTHRDERTVTDDGHTVDDTRLAHKILTMLGEALQSPSLEPGSNRRADIIARVLAEDRERKWQPSETAPEYTPVLALWSAGYMGVGQHDGEGWWEGDDVMDNPTHWMPLPAPPKDEQPSMHRGEARPSLSGREGEK